MHGFNKETQKDQLLPCTCEWRRLCKIWLEKMGAHWQLPSNCSGADQSFLLLETVSILSFIFRGFPVPIVNPAHMKGIPALRYVSISVLLCHLHWPYVGGMYPGVSLSTRGLYINGSGKHISEEGVQRACLSECDSQSSSIKRFSALGLNFLLISKL